MKIIGLIVVGLLGLATLLWEAYQARPNYLYINSSSLKNHAIYKVKDIPAISFGNSPVAGNNIPLGTTTPDYLDSFNLGSMEQSILESYLYFTLIQNRGVQWVFLGINPRTFPKSWGTKPLFQNPEIEWPKSLRRNKELGTDLLGKFPFKRVAPSLQLQWHSFLHQLKTRMYGDTYSSLIRGALSDDISYLQDFNSWGYKVLDEFLKKCRERSIKVLVYTVPIHNRDKVYNENDYNGFIHQTRRVVNRYSYSLLQLEDFLPSSSKYFIDFVHRTPEGNKLVAVKLKQMMEAHDQL